MSIFKCKMRGGTLEVNNETVAVCQYCGTKQTLPKLKDARKAKDDNLTITALGKDSNNLVGVYKQTASAE